MFVILEFNILQGLTAVQLQILFVFSLGSIYFITDWALIRELLKKIAHI